MFDLFGDLPTLKGQPSKSENSKDKEKNEKEKQSKSKNAGKESSASSATSIGSNNNRFFPVPTKTKSNPIKSMSLVGALGNAGTTMSFMPASLRKRNRTSVGNSSSGNIHKTATGSTNSMNAKKKKIENTILSEGEKTDQRIKNDIEIKENAGKSVIQSIDREDKPNVKNENNFQIIHDNKDQNSNQIGAVIISPSKSDQESEEMRLLHASVTDKNRYDPLIPNDLLAYRERKKNQRRRERLEEKARETLRLQQIMRKKIEEERKKVEATGDYQKIMENRIKTSISGNVDRISKLKDTGMGRGRGRGRGVSNLPAWLLKKQKAENSVGNQELLSGSKENKKEKSPSSSNTLVLLSNMTPPGEIDDDLSGEVKDECEIQCGPVKFVKIMDADENYKHVRVFVQFTESQHAEKASNFFHGRRFADRTISARLVNEHEISL